MQNPTTGEPTKEVPEIERYARSSLEQGERRVYLLGENRWEDPSSLAPAGGVSFCTQGSERGGGTCRWRRKVRVAPRA